MRMRIFVLLLAMNVPALPAMPVPAQAEFTEAAGWCALVTAPDGGYVTCEYRTRAQCLAALSGVGGICHENPSVDGRRIERSEKPRSHRAREM